MTGLDLGHLRESLRGGRIAIAQILRKHQIDAIVLLLGGDRDGQDFAFREL